MNAPTLFVGLGGTGSKIVAKVSEMIPEDQRWNVSSVIFDTDANDIPEIKDNHPEIRIVQTSARMKVGEYLERDHYARDNWFPVNPPLDGKVLSEGAAQVRSISRLGFEAAIKSGGMQPLFDAIQDLYKVDTRKADQALRVTIVSSLAGGTGSGLIVPVAMYIRQYLEDNFHENANLTRGFFILPEVFYNAVPDDQRNNLKSNAYASLRELDAFLMKGEKTLSDEYKDTVRLILPEPGTDQHKDYDIKPYEFCFLYDAQNAKGEKLNSLEQYMDHAASVIYANSIGPINKRSNSSEDNVLRKIAKDKGRNRYAGAGASRLIYPYDDICRLIGLNWASKSISQQWLEYDRRIALEKQRLLKKQEEGYAVDDLDTEEKYVNLVKADSDSHKPFARVIYNSVEGRSTVEDTEKTPALYDQYLSAIDEYIESIVNKDFGADLSVVLKAANIRKTKDVQNMKSSLDRANRALKQLHGRAKKYIELQREDLPYAIFQGASNEGTAEQPYFIETVIRSGNNGKGLHPNAVRYLLIQTKKRLAANNNHLKNELSPKAFDDIANGKFKQLNNQSLTNYKPKGFLGSSKSKRDLEAVSKEIEKRASFIDTYIKNSIKAAVYEKGIQYLSSLIQASEEFYRAFESQLKQIEKSRKEIYSRYTQAPGMTVRYVAASRNCLDKLSDRYPYEGSLISIDPELSRKITDRIFEYAKKPDKPNSSRYFADLFNQEILGHYQQDANKRVASQLDQGVMKAIELEANLVLDEDRKSRSETVTSYIVDVLNKTRELAVPYIEKPSALNPTSIDACAYNTILKPQKGDESYGAKLIHEHLEDKGGIATDEIDRNTIVFYQAYYGLRANSLSKFSPPKESETYKRNAGEYFAAYTDLIKGIHPNSRKSQEITPHIDRRWHLAAKMPDLDEGNQVIEEYGINAAFFWALVLELLDLKVGSSGQNAYQLKNIRLGLPEGTLIVDENRESSRLFEVLDALSLQLKYVDIIRAYVDSKMKDDAAHIKNVKEGNIYKTLMNIKVPMVNGFSAVGEDNSNKAEIRQISIFELPEVVKLSLPSGEQRDGRLLDLLTVAMKESVNYISGFCSPDEVNGAVKDFMSSELERFRANLKANNYQNVDNLTADTLDTAANFIKGYKLNVLSKEVQDLADELKKNYIH